MCFPIMHIAFKFQFFIHIFAMVKLKKTDQKFERGGFSSRIRLTSNEGIDSNSFGCRGLHSNIGN